MLPETCPHRESLVLDYWQSLGHLLSSAGSSLQVGSREERQERHLPQEVGYSLPSLQLDLVAAYRFSLLTLIGDMAGREGGRGDNRWKGKTVKVGE